MDDIGIYAPAIIAILGIAYPIILQAIARLDETYSSTLVIELFEKEPRRKWFLYQLYISLVLLLIWTLKLDVVAPFDKWGSWVYHSALILVAVSTVLLIVSFLLLVKRIFIYLSQSAFTKYLIHNHNKDVGLKYFQVLTDVFLNAINKKNYAITGTISQFYYIVFKKEREKFKDSPVIYPDAFYLLVYNTIEELAIQNDRRNASLEVRSAGSIWLLGELQGYEISDTTYGWLWHNLVLAVKYEQDDMVLRHWETAHQYFSFHLQSIHPLYEGTTAEPQNKAFMEKREIERDKFLELHFALGGLLLYKKRYACMQRIFNYTTSQPPTYDLLPDTMTEIFERYIEFRDPFEIRYPWISSKYGFPGLEGMNSGNIIKMWISSYLSVLFLRQYTIIPYLSFMTPLAQPQLPSLQDAKKRWIDNLDFFKKLISDSMQNAELMDGLNLKFITREWCDKNKYVFPLDFINELKEKLFDSYGRTAVTVEVSSGKVDEFYKTTTSILDKVLLSYSEIMNTKSIQEDFSKWYIDGYNTPYSKDAFTANPETNYIDFDSFLASALSDKIKRGIGETFLVNRTKNYLLKKEDLFHAVEKLKIKEDYLVISFGVDIENYKIRKMFPDGLRNIQTLEYPDSRTIRGSLFIVKKSDLPSFIFEEINEELSKKFSPKEISKQFKIYASVLDLNKADKEILNEYGQGKTEEELKKSVLLLIFLNLEIRWKKKINLIQLIEYSEYRQKGLPNDLDDVIAI